MIGLCLKVFSDVKVCVVLYVVLVIIGLNIIKSSGQKSKYLSCYLFFDKLCSVLEYQIAESVQYAVCNQLY